MMTTKEIKQAIVNESLMSIPVKYFHATVTFRPDQYAAVRRLQNVRKLSAVCQKAVDEIEEVA
jgi:hypothetical protein